MMLPITATPGVWGLMVSNSAATMMANLRALPASLFSGSCCQTHCLIVVIRYFGGTKLGVPGLIAAYKESAAEVIAEAEIIEQTVDTHFTIEFPYLVMNDVMRIIKEEQPNILSQDFDNLCTMRLSIRESRAEGLLGKLRKVESANIELIDN